MSRMKPEKPVSQGGSIKGSCLCGSIHYSSNATHNERRRSRAQPHVRASGFWHAHLLSIPHSSLSLRGKRPIVDEDQDVDGNSILHTSCADCGTLLFTESDKTPFVVYIAKSTLEQTLDREPAPEVAVVC